MMKQFENMCDEIRAGRQAAEQKMTFPYMRRWWRGPQTDAMNQALQDAYELRSWQRDLAVADLAEQEQMLAALRSHLPPG